MARSEHGAMPIPERHGHRAPARGARVLARRLRRAHDRDGAAILAATVEGYGEIPALRIEEVGYGRAPLGWTSRTSRACSSGWRSRQALLPSVPGTPELRLVPEPREPGRSRRRRLTRSWARRSPTRPAEVRPIAATDQSLQNAVEARTVRMVSLGDIGLMPVAPTHSPVIRFMCWRPLPGCRIVDRRRLGGRPR